MLPITYNSELVSSSFISHSKVTRSFITKVYLIDKSFADG